MEIRLTTSEWNQAQAEWLLVSVFQSDELPGPLATLDDALSGQLTRLRQSGDLTGKLAEILALPDVPGIAAKRLLLIGLGNPAELQRADFDKAMTTAIRHVSTKKSVSVAAALPHVSGDLISTADCAQATAIAACVGSFGQDLYREEPGRFPLSDVEILVETDRRHATVADAIQKGTILGEAINLTRELVNRPPQEIFPVSFAEKAERLAIECGLGCEVLDENQLNDERMGSLLAVASGSDQPPRVVVLEHRGADDDLPTLALVGKGVTFDSGGLSLKSTDSMKMMKSDMAGAATVLGAMSAIARLKLPVNVVGFLGLVENMVSGRSYKMGDVLTARNGITIEVLNTDAEGRLVLADILSYAIDRGADKLIDLATLTGACVVALGEDVTGVFTNNQPWCGEVQAAAKRCGENVWQLPMFKQYAELIKSDVADIKNVGGRWAGAITAAKFLEKFVGNIPWVHLDIAGPSFASSNNAHREGGGTGCMVRTLVETATTFSEEK